VPFPSQAKKPAANDDLEPDWDDQDQDDVAGKMSFLEHLDELRRRIIWSVASIGVGVLIVAAFIDNIFGFIMRPMQAMLPAGQTLIYTDPSEAFLLQIKIALIAGLIVASPMVFTQVWLFIAPGLYQHEKRLAIPFVVMSTVLFVSGAAFSHYAVFPLVWRFFVGFSTDYLTFMPRVEPAFSMYLRLMLALGITFQLPTIVLFLARMGMITPRFMIRNFKFAVLLIVIAAAVLSPDGGGVGMVVMGAPVVVLYILSIGLAWAFGKKRRVDDDTVDSEA
jgi:sec-independent protein translocase protein TatC